MILGAGVGQLPLIRKARDVGLEVVVVSIDGDYPGFDEADIPIRMDFKDREMVLQAAQELEICAVLTTQTDLAVPTVAYVAEKMGLPGIGAECARKFTDKYLIRSLTEDLDVTPVRWARVDSLDDALEAVITMEYPLVIKPVDNQGGRGVFKVGDEGGLRNRFPEALGQALGGGVLVEEYFEGVELRLDGLMIGGEFLNLPLGDTVFFDSEELFIPQSVSYPSEIPSSLREKVLARNESIVRRFGLPFGLAHAEYRVSEDTGEICLLEIAARGGGQFISSDLIPLACGLDVELILLRQALGDPPSEIQVLHERASGYYSAGPFRPGVLLEIRRLEEALRLPGVHRVVQKVREGGILPSMATKVDRPLTFILYGETRRDLDATIRALEETVTLLVETERGIEEMGI